MEEIENSVMIDAELQADRIDLVLEYFRKLYIHLKPSWVGDCLEQFPQNQTEDQDIYAVFQQFCVQDMKEYWQKSEEGFREFKTTDIEEQLESPRVVQIESVVNVGIPTRAQIEEDACLSDDSDDEKWESRYLDSSAIEYTDSGKIHKKQAETNRMLKFILFDGNSKITATEIVKLDSLTIDT